MSWAGTSKGEFETLAGIRLREARALFAVQLFDGAYYLGGYALECALKAVVVKTLPAQTLVHHRHVQDFHTHDLAALMRYAQLDYMLDTDRRSRPGLDTSWTVVNRWSEQERYAHGVDPETASEFLISIDDPNDGVLPWVMKHW